MPSKSALKVYQKLQNTVKGITVRELETLYKGYGFEMRSQKGSHATYVHPEYKHVKEFPRPTLAIHAGELHPDYARKARSVIEKLLELQGKEAQNGE